MSTATGLAIFVTMAAVLGCLIPSGIGADDLILALGMTVRFTCTGPGQLPTWHVNERVAESNGNCYRLTIRRAAGMNSSAILTINGNQTCDTFNIHCGIVVSESQLLYARNVSQFSLIFQDHLLAPENLYINESVDSSNVASVIEWTPPYSAVSNETVHVDPHITQYTVYIIDSYTGDVVKANVTDNHFTFNNQGNVLCPIYQVSAWNSGGEGKLSEPVQESTPRVPRNVLVESVTVRGTVTTNVVHIHINNVDVVCTSRIPEFFLITLMTSTGSVLNETRQHQLRQEVADFTISLPPSVDVCSLHVRISAGNSAGMSSPSEAVVVDCPDDSTDSTTTTASATTVLTATSTGGRSEGNSQQGNNTALIVAITIGVIAPVGVTLVVGIMCCLKHKSKNSKVKRSDQTDNHYTESPSLGGPLPLYKLPVPEAVYVTSEQTTSRPVARDPEHTAISMQTLDSAPSTLQTSVAMVPEAQTQRSYSSSSSPSTISGRSDDLLLPPNPPVPASRPNLVYAQVNVQQTQVPPPANDDHVQYAQIKQQDKM